MFFLLNVFSALSGPLIAFNLTTDHSFKIAFAEVIFTKVVISTVQFGQ